MLVLPTDMIIRYLSSTLFSSTFNFKSLSPPAWVYLNSETVKERTRLNFTLNLKISLIFNRFLPDFLKTAYDFWEDPRYEIDD